MTTEDTSASQALRCPQCGAWDARPRRFCGECGTDLLKVATAGAERRSLTVMFCDVVGSTALSERLDPEELGELIVGYREIVATAAARFGGFVARYVGDGILVYFGYPRAHGDDPVRALHVALETLHRMREWNTRASASRGINIPVRIGLHTGLVVVGELGRGATREEAGALGETPNLAARIMSLAPVDGILVSAVTHALTERHFKFRDWGERPIEGLSRPVRLFEPVEVVRAPDAFSAALHVTPLANRTRELAVLESRWSEVLGGRGCAVAVVGEPGIGKTRLVRAFADGLTGSLHRKIALQCSQYFSNSAFHPLVDYFNRRIEASSQPALQQLASAITGAGMAPDEGVPLLAPLLGIALEAPYRAPQASARVQRDAMMAFLGDWLLRIARARPTLLVIEDLQWADASTLELVTRLMESLSSVRVLLVTTFRSQFKGPWSGPTAPSQLHVERLTTPHVLELIGHVTEGRALSPELIEQVAQRTDGVPLFVEELTKAVIEKPTRPAGEADIPISLHATLMARLDSMNAAKLVAQRASVLGREFSYELIAASAGLEAEELDRGLLQLVEAELLFQFGVAPGSTYLFKHSMIQETAYRSLLRAQRREHHLRIARALVQRSTDDGMGRPELVAHHFSEGHEPLSAAPYWRAAGEQALARSANVEAYAHLRKGLDELAACPASREKLQEEVSTLVAFGSALSALKGSAAPEVEQTYARASELVRDLSEPQYLFPVLRGLHSFYVVRGPLRTATAMAEQLRDMAQAGDDPVQRVEADRRLGWCRFCMGDIAAGRASLRQAVDAYDRSRSVRHIMTVGSDPAVIGLVNLAWLEGFAGRPAQALEYSRQSIRLAREISYDLGLAYALGMSAALHQCLGSPARTAELARETIELAQSRGFPYWVAWETALLGWASAALGDFELGVAMIDSGIASYRDTGSALFCAHMLGLLADANMQAGRHDAALRACEDALAFSEKTDAHFFDPEIERLEAECLVRRDRNDQAAMTCFANAIERAHRQGAGMLEMRATLGLARLHLSAGRPDEARAVLGCAIDRFDGEAACAELVGARQLLASCPGTQR